KTNAVKIVKIVQAEAVSETTAAFDLVGLTGVFGDIDGDVGVRNHTDDIDFQKKDEEIVKVDASEAQAVPIDRSMLDASDQGSETEMSNPSTVELAAALYMPTLAFSASMENLILEGADQIEAEDMITDNTSASMVPNVNNEITVEATSSNDSTVEVGVVNPIAESARQVEHEEQALGDKEKDVANINNGNSENSLSDTGSQADGSQLSDVTMADSNNTTSGSPASIALNSVKDVSKQRLKKIKSKLRREQEALDGAAEENVLAVGVHAPDSISHFEPNVEFPVDQATRSVVYKTNNNGNKTVSDASSPDLEEQDARKSSASDKQCSGLVEIAEVTRALEASTKTTAPTDTVGVTDNVRDIVNTDGPVRNQTEDLKLEKKGEVSIPAEMVKIDSSKAEPQESASVATPMKVLTKNQKNKLRSKIRCAEEAKATNSLENANVDILQHSASPYEINGLVNSTITQNIFHTTKQRKEQKRLAITKTKTRKSPHEEEITVAPSDVAQTISTNPVTATANPTPLSVKKAAGTPIKVPNPTTKSPKSTRRTKKFGDISILHLPDRDAENQAIISSFDNAELTEDGEILVHVKGAPSYSITTQRERQFRLELAASNARVAEIDRRIAEEDALAAIGCENVGGKSNLVSESGSVTEIASTSNTIEDAEGRAKVVSAEVDGGVSFGSDKICNESVDGERQVGSEPDSSVTTTTSATNVVGAESVEGNGELVSAEADLGAIKDRTKEDSIVGDGDRVNTTDSAAAVTADSEKGADVSVVVLPALPMKIISTSPSYKVTTAEKLMAAKISITGEETVVVGKDEKPASSCTMISDPESPVTEVLVPNPGTINKVTKSVQPLTMQKTGVDTAINNLKPEKEFVINDTKTEMLSKNEDTPARLRVVTIDSGKAANLILLARLSEPGPNGDNYNYSLFRDDRQPGFVFKVVE
ncbi:hypothetical protein HDU76_006312, partial [Blyttiomyces sp. JEL0837]